MNEVLERPEIKNIISTVLLNKWDTDYAIRYVVVEISKLVQRDVSFFAMDEESRLALMNEVSYVSTYPEIICKTLHELIRDVLEELGIKSRVIVATNTRVPLYALIVEGERGRYYIDALYDLFRSQHRIQPVTFGNIIYSNNTVVDEHNYHLIRLSLDYIREMDLGLGVIDEEYFSDYIDRIKTEFVLQNRAKKIFGVDNSLDLIPVKMRYISENLINLYPVRGTMERIGLYVYYRSNLFNKNEKSNFLVRRKEDNSIYFTISYGGFEFVFEEEKKDGLYSIVQKSLVKKR